MNYYANSGLKPEANGIAPGSSGAGRKRSCILPLLVLLSTVFVCVLGSLGQSILKSGRNTISDAKTQNLLRDNPVFSPLVKPGRLSGIQFFPGIHAVYDGGRMAAPDFSLIGRTAGQWWIADDEDSPEQADWIPGSTDSPLLQKPARADSYLRLQALNLDPNALLMDSITMGVVDLLSALREKDIQRQAGPDVLMANPFAEALKKASDEAAGDSVGPANTEETKAESEPAAEEKSGEEGEAVAEKEGSGGSSSKIRNFLFVGAFGSQTLTIAAGTAAPDLNSRSVSFDMDDKSKLAFDMDIVLRSRANQESAAFGDLNLDGFLDMVVTNMATNAAEIFLNDGQGSYILTAQVWGGLGPAAAVISDFNADSSPDIAVVTQTDKRIVVDGKGYRRFILPSSGLNDEYSSIIPFDFNGDGLNDVLLSNYRNLTADVYLNQGAGFFASASSYALQSFPCLQSASDLNADGIPDLIYVQYLGSYLSIIMQNGRDGSISGLGNTALDPALHYILGDFNRDGVVDIAVAQLR